MKKLTIEDLPRANPLDRYDWTGRLVSTDDTPTDDFTKEDVAEVLYVGATPDDWDGECAGILLLKDGRYATFETNWGPTGDGFSADAYGGDADIHFSSTLEEAIKFGLTDSGRSLCGIETPS